MKYFTTSRNKKVAYFAIMVHKHLFEKINYVSTQNLNNWLLANKILALVKMRIVFS